MSAVLVVIVAVAYAVHFAPYIVTKITTCYAADAFCKLRINQKGAPCWTSAPPDPLARFRPKKVEMRKRDGRGRKKKKEGKNKKRGKKWNTKSICPQDISNYTYLPMISRNVMMTFC